MNSLNSQVNIFTESFNEFDGSTAGVSDEGVPWSSVCPTCQAGDYYQVQGGTFENSDSNGPATWTTDPIDISSCSRITVDISYSGTDFGSGGLEASSDCSGCNGDPDDALQPECQTCWDFMQFKINIDGVFTEMALIGTTNTSSVFQVDWEDENCPNLGDNAFLEIVSQTWGATELMRFDNVAMVCYEDAGPDATLSGTADLCPGQCVDVDWDVSGGSAPYNLTFELSLGGFSLSEGLPGLPNMGSLTICYDDGGVSPTFDIGTNTLNITDLFGTAYMLELINVTDNDGCTTTLNGQVININLGSTPTINTIPPIEVCASASNPFDLDLSEYDVDIGGGQNVEYYADLGLTMPIGPIVQISSNTTIYAVVNAGAGCVSDPISIQVQLQAIPEIDNPGPVESCGEYILPDITGTNLTNTISYWSGPNQSGAAIAEGTPITSDLILYIYDEGNGCPSEIIVSIDILPQPDVFDQSAIVACGSYTLPEILGDNLSGNERYYTQPNGAGIIYSPDDVIMDDIVLYIYDEIGMCNDQAILIISITDGPEINMPDTLSSCNSLLLPVIDGDDISTDASYFTGQNGTGAEFTPGTQIDGDIILYAFDGTTDCFDEKLIIIVVPQQPELDEIEDVVECDYYELPNIEGSNLENPFYSDESGNIYNVGDTIFGSINPFVVGDSIQGDGIIPTCITTVSFSITIIENPTAGADVTFNDCGGSIVDLIDLIGTDADSGGMFIDTSTTGALSGTNLDVSQINGNSFSVFYEVINMCGIDTSIYTVNITDNADAGNNTSSSVCENEDLNLIDFTSDSDPGGIFINTEDGSMGSVINSNEIVDAGGSLLFYYIVGQGGTCDPDTSEINFVVVNSPMLTLPEDETLCSVYELPSITGTGLAGNETYNTENDGSGITYEVGDTLENSDILYVQAGSGQCAALDSFEITIILTPPTLIEETLCNDDTLTVNGEMFWFGNETGTQTFTTSDGCDSLVEIELSFFETDTNFITEEVCYGGVFEFFGVTLDKDKTSTQIIFPFADKNDCDSVIFVNIFFAEPLTKNIEASLCQNDSLLVNGVYYSVNNPSGIDTMVVENNCDTILFINLTFEDDINILIDDTLCIDEVIVVNGNPYDFNNPEGDEMISGSDGCDSLITIDLDFYEESIGMITGSFCINDVIDTLGETFDINNPEMEVLLEGASAQNCDSTVFVSFSFDQFDEGVLDTVVCETVNVIIGGVTFNASNPSGLVTLQNSQGCDSIVSVNYSIQQSEADVTIVDASCGFENGFVIFNSVTPSSSEYFYAIDAISQGFIEPGDTIFNLTPGDHNLIFAGSDNCPAELDFTIVEADDLSIEIPSEITITENNSFQLNITGLDDATINWTPPTGLSCTDCPNPEFSPAETTEYIVTAVNDAGCFATDTILIRIEEIFDIYIPNTFTPNDDGLNDVFTIFSESDVPYDISIYDRWGNRVFEGIDLTTNDTSTGWDGRFNNASVTQGIYVYVAVLRVEEDEDPELINGTITVVR